MMRHWSKTQALSIGSEYSFVSSHGHALPAAASMQYLAAVVDRDGRVDSELSRKIGAVRAEFREFAKVWNHASIPVSEKVQFFHALVMSKL